MTDDTIHTCSYECERPGCIRAQRDEMVAKVEALRAEVERSERYAEQSERDRLWAEERAERLAEALRELVDVFSESGMYDDEVFAKARAALDQDKGGGYWPEMPKNGSPDWTGFDG